MKRLAIQFTLITALILFGGLACNSVAAEIEGLGDDGWYTWTVLGIDDAPSWCCFTWRGGVRRQKSCDLDSKQVNYGPDEHILSGDNEMQIVAFVEAGIATKVRAINPQCPITTRDTIIDLGLLEADDSVKWLEQTITPRTTVSTHALAAISVHAGKTSREVLKKVAQHDVSFENRKDAVFWMGQVRGREMAKDIKNFMFNDENPKFREHAAFSLSQSDAPGRDEALIQLGKQDSEAKVRGIAWFWLAQTAASVSESAIEKALVEEDNSKVRHQAIFALSQLPEKRALDALITVIENRRLAFDDRKQALFWLADLGSDQAMAYMDSLLSVR